ncbi:MAG: response regulator [Carboxylicivirga sp.]|nr:response regulator [Carboxylicivirga sp.]
MKENGRILIIDDNPKNVQLLANILHVKGYEIEVGLSGEEALNWMQDEVFDLLMLDVMMPKMNGYHVCKEIRNDERHKNMPIIFISAKTDKQSIVKGFEAGGQDYVTKPFNEEELLARVSTQIGLKKSREELTTMNAQLEDKVKERTQELYEANQRLVEIDNKRNKFLSFIGTEVRAPIIQMEKSLKAIKMSAESSNLVGLLTDLNQSYVKLKRITNLTNKMVNIHNKKFGNRLNDVAILGIVDMVLTNLDSMIEGKDLQMKVEVNEEAVVKANYDLLIESIRAFITFICTYSDQNSELKVSFDDSDATPHLRLEGLLSDKYGEYAEELGLYTSYSELIMEFQNGAFTVENEDKKYVLSWKFN